MSVQNSKVSHHATPGDEFQRDAGLQPDPELQEGPASAGRIAVYAVAIVVLLGAVFFGLNSNPTTTATSPSASTTAENTQPPAANTQPGTTTGAAPASKAQPPQANPTGTQVDQNKGQPK